MGTICTDSKRLVKLPEQEELEWSLVHHTTACGCSSASRDAIRETQPSTAGNKMHNIKMFVYTRGVEAVEASLFQQLHLLFAQTFMRDILFVKCALLNTLKLPHVQEK